MITRFFSAICLGVGLCLILASFWLWQSFSGGGILLVAAGFAFRSLSRRGAALESELRCIAGQLERHKTDDALAAKDREIESLQAEIVKLGRGARHDRLHRVHREIGEAFLFDFVKLRDDLASAAQIADYHARRAAHVAAGGNPDDDPRTWRGRGDEK